MGVVATSGTLGPVKAGSAIFPVFTSEKAFGNGPGDAVLSWADTSTWLRRFNYTRGRQYELNRMTAGTGTETLLNTDRRFDPANAAGPYAPNVVPIVPARLSAFFASVNYPLFTMFVQRWPQQRTGPTYAESVVELIDGFDLLANAILPGAAYPQELSGSRINRVLDAIGWSSSSRNIDAGNSTIPDFTFATADGVAALDHLLDVVDAEVGLFFIAADGRATFKSRRASLNTASQATFTDQPSVDAGAIPYTDVVATIDKDLIFNDWVGTRAGGATQEALDSTAIARFGRRPQIRTPLLTSDAEVMQQMQFLLSQYKTPAMRIRSITIQPGNQSAAWTQVLARDLTDRITVRMHPPGGGATIVQDSFIQQINLVVDLHAGTAKCVWQLLPVDLLGYWFANRSAVGTDTRAGY